MMDFEARAAKLRKHPDTVMVELCGEERPWILGKVTFDMAREAGTDLGEILGQFDGMDADGGLGAVDTMLGAFGSLLYFGMRPFEEGLQEEDVTTFLSVGDIERLSPILLGQFSAHAEAEAKQAAGKAQSQRDRTKRAA